MKPAFCKDILDQVSKIAQKIQDPITPGKHKSFDKLDASSAAAGEQLSPEYTGASAPLHSLLSIASLELSSAVTGGVYTTGHYADRTMFYLWSNPQVHCPMFMFTFLFAVPHLALYPNKLLARAFFNIICASLERFLPQSISETCLQHTAGCKHQGQIKIS